MLRTIGTSCISLLTRWLMLLIGCLVSLAADVVKDYSTSRLCSKSVLLNVLKSLYSRYLKK